jgi:putative transposase
MEPNYVGLKEAMAYFKLSAQTLRKLADTGKIRHIRSNGQPNGHRRYDINSFKSKELPCTPEKKNFVIVECPQDIKPMISNDKSHSCKTNFQDTKLSLISAPELISKERTFSKLSMESLMEVSKRLWLPTKIDSVDLGSSLSNISVKEVNANSSFLITKIKPMNKNSMKISYQSLQSLEPELTERENIPEDKVLRTFQVRFYPSKNDKQILESWFGAARLTYNTCINEFNKNRDAKLTKYMYRDMFVPEHKIQTHDKLKHTLSCPKDIRGRAALDFYTAWKNEQKKIASQQSKIRYYLDNKDKDKAILAIKKLEKMKNFKMKFRKKRDKQSIGIERAGYKFKNDGLVIYPTFGLNPIRFNNRSLKRDDRLIQFLQNQARQHAMRLIKTITNKYYLCIQNNVAVPKQHIKEDNILAIDPGVRTFLTGYDPSGEILEIDDGNKIMQMKAKLNQYPRNKRLHAKLTNFVRDMHCKVAKYLTQRYAHILLPEFNSQQMLKTHALGSKNNFKLQKLSHYSFKMRLKDKALLTGRKVDICSEAYTSKRCSSCGNMNNNLGSSLTYRCLKCNACYDRDHNAARNILLKQLI